MTNEETETNENECEEQVVKKIRERRDAGRAKYGTSMERTDLSMLQWLQHAQEEAMDHAIYLEKLIKLEKEREDFCTIKLTEKLKELDKLNRLVKDQREELGKPGDIPKWGALPPWDKSGSNKN